MGQEIERKFLVRNDGWRGEAGDGVVFCQGYLATTAEGQSVRVRLAGDAAMLTIKGPTVGLSRAEFEYAIPVEDAREMLETLCQRPFVEKTRYRIPAGPVTWEVDVFHGENDGLILAEVELDRADQEVVRPDWIGDEVSEDERYFSMNLGRCPISRW